MARTYVRTPWRIEITLRAGTARLGPAPRLADLVARVLAAAGAPSPATVGIILGPDAELARLNERVIGRPEPTDVLAFPLLPPAAFPTHEGQDPRDRAEGPVSTFVLPPDEPTHLGEIVVSVERAVEQAGSGRGGQTGDVTWSAADELRLLVVHGVLHLCGWDHADAGEGRAMRALERRLLGLDATSHAAS